MMKDFLIEDAENQESSKRRIQEEDITESSTTGAKGLKKMISSKHMEVVRGKTRVIAIEVLGNGAETRRFSNP
ncbi:hypothetical protein Tco_1277945 [Tanacetum coccineum]